MPHAAGHLDLVALDLHPPTASVAELPAREVAVERVPVQLEPGGKSLEDAGEAGAVRLAGRGHTERHRR